MGRKSNYSESYKRETVAKAESSQRPKRVQPTPTTVTFNEPILRFSISMFLGPNTCIHVINLIRLQSSRTSRPES